jgi:hypothetical protein
LLGRKGTLNAVLKEPVMLVSLKDLLATLASIVSLDGNGFASHLIFKFSINVQDDLEKETFYQYIKYSFDIIKYRLISTHQSCSIVCKPYLT